MWSEPQPRPIVPPARARRGRALVACALLSLAAAAAAFSAGDGKATRRSIYPSDFPPGNGRAVAQRACLICHSASLITQQAKDSTGWEKSIGQMEKWGVKLNAAEHDSLRSYLLGHFGPRAK